MRQCLLFVDDETALLRSMDRAFCGDFDVSSAESGPDAIDLLKATPFPVVVTDMRMPSMDGIEFIKAAREISPDSIYIMLSGNQDLGTATRAVNEGEVFRFLNKPCELADLRRAIDAGLRYHELVRGEKELLHKTFVGAVSVVSGVLERAHPELAGAGSVVGRVIGTLCSDVGIDNRWEFKLAGRLSLVGFALLGEERDAMNRGVDPIAEEPDAHAHAATEASSLIEKIPRLETVARIIKGFPTADGSICNLHPGSEAAVCQVGASLLRIALQVRHALNQGLESSAMAAELRASLPDLNDSIHQSLSGFDAEGIAVEAAAAPIQTLTPGMVLHGDLEGPAGEKLLRSGKRLDAAAVEKINQVFAQSSTTNVSVSATSFEAFSTGSA